MKYKWKDKVRIKSKKELECISEVTDGMLKNGGAIMTIACLVEDADGYIMKEDGDFHFLWSDEMIEGLVEEETKSENWLLDEYEELTDRAFKGGYEKCKSDIELNGFQLPEGYIFKDENGNVINATKIVLEKKKKEYPKTYEECCKVLNIAVRDLDILDNMLDTTEIIYSKNLDRLLNSFRKLLICRDAYWKIAGEEMGLGKPWKPDCNRGYFIPSIIYRSGFIQKVEVQYRNAILSFPTEEMRDAFYENFKELINECKELL